MKKFPESVSTKDRKGNLEVRSLISRGKYVIYDYRDPKTFKQVEGSKKKLYLLNEEGRLEEYYIIPLPGNRSLFIEPKEKEEKPRKVWNDKKSKEEDLF